MSLDELEIHYKNDIKKTVNFYRKAQKIKNKQKNGNFLLRNITRACLQQCDDIY